MRNALRFPRNCPPSGLVRRAKAGCVVVVEERVVIPSKEKKVVGRIFCLSSLKCFSLFMWGRPVQSKQSTLGRNWVLQVRTFLGRLLSNQQLLGRLLDSVSGRQRCAPASAAAHPSPKLKSSSLIRDPERLPQRQLCSNSSCCHHRQFLASSPWRVCSSTSTMGQLSPCCER